MNTWAQKKDWDLFIASFVTLECDRLYLGKNHRVTNGEIANLKWKAIVKDTATNADSTAEVEIDSDSDPLRFTIDTTGDYPVLTVFLVTSSESADMIEGIYAYTIKVYDTVSSNQQDIMYGELTVKASPLVTPFAP